MYVSIAQGNKYIYVVFNFYHINKRYISENYHYHIKQNILDKQINYSEQRNQQNVPQNSKIRMNLNEQNIFPAAKTSPQNYSLPPYPRVPKCALTVPLKTAYHATIDNYTRSYISSYVVNTGFTVLLCICMPILLQIKARLTNQSERSTYLSFVNGCWMMMM